MNLTCAVVVKTASMREIGNRYNPILYDKDGGVNLRGMIDTYMPTFEVSEILIIDNDTGREVGGLQRKPSKWDVELEYFDRIGDAVKRALELRQLV